MKIVMLTSDYLPNIGGIASHIYELSKALIANGHEVEVWFWDRKETHPKPAEMGEVPVRTLSVFKSVRFGWGEGKRLAQAIDRTLPLFQADILHLHTLDPLMSALRQVSKDFAGKKVWTNHSSRFLRKVDSFFWRQKMRFLGKAFDGLLAPSTELLDRSLFMGFGVRNSLYVANGVDIQKFGILDKADARRELGLQNDKFILLSTRRFAPKNGIRHLANALPQVVREIPETLCVFCGNLPDAKDWLVVQDIVRENQLEPFTRFEGAIPNADINTYLNAADLVVLPSLMEATSISGLEAMSAGRPLVGTRVGGIPELIDEGHTGFLVEPGDPHALAAGIIRAYQELDFAEAGRRARLKVESQYTWVSLARKVADFYQRI